MSEDKLRRLSWRRIYDGTWLAGAGAAEVSAPPSPRRWRIPAAPGALQAEGAGADLPAAIAAASNEWRRLNGWRFE